MKTNICKKTEVGEIPVDWKVKSIDKIAHPVRGGSPRPAGDPKYFNGAYIPWLTVAALTNIPESQLVVRQMETCLTKEGSLRSRTLDPGTIIIANSGATLGVAKLLGVLCCANDGIAALLNISNDVSPNYIAHFINSKTSYLRDVVATGNGQPNLNTGLIGNLKIPFPPTIAEQETIAEALSDADALIESLEKLIAKKCLLKQGAMQELLTGKRRLPGFKGDWITKRLGELGEITGAGVDKKIRPGEIPVRLVNYMDVYRHNVIHSSMLSHVVSAPTEQATRCSVKKGDVFFTPSSEMPYDIAASAIAAEDIKDAAYSYHIVRLRFSEDWDLIFRAFAFKTEMFLAQAARASEGSGVRYVISQKRFRELTVTYPPSKDEQEKIGLILNDIQSEIVTLDAKLSKSRQIKRGMMQELLTGKTRLKASGGAHA